MTQKKMKKILNAVRDNQLTSHGILVNSAQGKQWKIVQDQSGCDSQWISSCWGGSTVIVDEGGNLFFLGVVCVVTASLGCRVEGWWRRRYRTVVEKPAFQTILIRAPQHISDGHQLPWLGATSPLGHAKRHPTFNSKTSRRNPLLWPFYASELE